MQTLRTEALRIIVYHYLHNDILTAFSKRVEELVVGDPAVPETALGAVVSLDQQARVLN